MAFPPNRDRKTVALDMGQNRGVNLPSPPDNMDFLRGRVIGSGSNLIGGFGVVITLATFVRQPTERISILAFLVDDALLDFGAWDIGAALPLGVKIWARKTGVADTFDVRARNDDAGGVARTLEWLVWGVIP